MLKTLFSCVAGSRLRDAAIIEIIDSSLPLSPVDHFLNTLEGQHKNCPTAVDSTR